MHRRHALEPRVLGRREGDAVNAPHAAEGGHSTQRAAEWLLGERVEGGGAAGIDGGVGYGDGGHMHAARQRGELGVQRGCPDAQHAQQEVPRQGLECLQGRCGGVGVSDCGQLAFDSPGTGVLRQAGWPREREP